MNNRICFDVEELDSLLKVKGAYTGFHDERLSFSIKGIVCD